MQQMLEQLKRDFNSFAYSASHDLQAPVQVIYGYLRLMKFAAESNKPIGSESVAEQMERPVARLQSQLTDLLAFSRLSTRQEAPIELNLATLVQSAADIKGIAIELTAPEAPALVWASRKHIALLIEQLLDNAQKFAQPNGPANITISISLHPKHTVLCIQDAGIGISEEHLPYVWDLFRTFKSSQQAGNGIGLTLCKRICELNNCSIELQSTENEGTRIEISIPRNPSHAQH